MCIPFFIQIKHCRKFSRIFMCYPVCCFVLNRLLFSENEFQLKAIKIQANPLWL